jgi:hypothetical protein
VHAILRRHGCSRAPKTARGEVCRYEWPCPGDLMHVDVKKYPRFKRAGHAVTGDRTKTYVEKQTRLGDFFHAMVDDHSRLVYGELLAAFFGCALAAFAARGIQVRRVMTDGAWSYTRNRDLRQLLSAGAQTGAITGGTGKYRDVDGEFSVEVLSETEANITFFLDD